MKRRGYPVSCRSCSCTEMRACPGGCAWTRDTRGRLTDLCTTCEAGAVARSLEHVLELETHVDLSPLLFDIRHQALRQALVEGLADCPVYRVIAGAFYGFYNEVGLRPGAIVQGIPSGDEERDLVGLYPMLRVEFDPADVWFAGSRRTGAAYRKKVSRGAAPVLTSGLEPLTQGAWDLLAAAGDRRLPPKEWPRV